MKQNKLIFSIFIIMLLILSSCTTGSNGNNNTHQHEYDYECDEVCNICGEERVVSHKFTNGCDTTCDIKECSFKRDVKHTPENEDYDCTTDLLCSVCGEILVVGNLSHNFSSDDDTSCDNEGCIYVKDVTHIPSEDDYDCTTDVICTICNEVLVKGNTEHAFDNDCDSQCNNIGCKFERITNHVEEEDDYNCETELKCSICHVILVPALSHVFDSEEDTSCNNQNCHYSKEISDCIHVDVDNNNMCDSCKESVSVNIDIIGVNDLHGMFEDTSSQVGLDEFTTWIKNKEKDLEAYELLISQGDMWQGSAESGINKGAMMTEWMNYMNFASMTLGNHEFDWGEKYVKSNSELADFPFLAINIRDLSGNPVSYCKPSTTIEFDNVKIGIIGAIGDCLSSISGEFNGNLNFIVGSELTKLVQQEALELRNNGCDFIIYSVHNGYDSLYDEVLSNKNSGKGYVDLVLEGHTHQSYVTTDSYGVYHVQSGSYNEEIGNIRLVYNFVNNTYTLKVDRISSSVYGSNSIKDSEIIDDLMNEYFPADDDPSTPTNPYKDVLGFNSTALDSNDLLNIVAALYLEKGQEKWGSSYDIALAGGYLNTREPYDLHAGDITYADLYQLLPFDNHIVLGSLSGSKLNQKFLQSTYYTYKVRSGFNTSNISSNSKYYVIVDTYTSYYSSNGITNIDILEEGVYARDLLAEYIKEGKLDNSAPVETSTISSIKTSTVGAYYKTEGIIVGSVKNGYMLMDYSGKNNTPAYIYVYLGSTSINNFNIGDKVSVQGSTSTYQNQVQFAAGTTAKVISSNNNYTKPTLINADGTYLNSLLSNGLTVGEYVTIKGTLSISGNYHNVKVEGLPTNVMVSFPQPLSDMSSYSGKEITITGYLAYIQGSSKKYIYIIPESIN